MHTTSQQKQRHFLMKEFPFFSSFWGAMILITGGMVLSQVCYGVRTSETNTKQRDGKLIERKDDASRSSKGKRNNILNRWKSSFLANQNTIAHRQSWNHTINPPLSLKQINQQVISPGDYHHGRLRRRKRFESLILGSQSHISQISWGMVLS